MSSTDWTKIISMIAPFIPVIIIGAVIVVDMLSIERRMPIGVRPAPITPRLRSMLADMLVRVRQ